MISFARMRFCALAVFRRGVVPVALAALVPLAATADPIHLKLSFFTSLDIPTYKGGVKPFVDRINAEGKGLIVIDVYPDGVLGKGVAEQSKLVSEGVVDIAWIVPGQTPYRFPDNDLLEQPGLFRDAREGTLTYTRLIAANALRGYENLFVITAVTPAPAYIHSRKRIDSLAALKGQRLRANNPTEAEALGRLGAQPTVLAITMLAEATRRGAIDGAALGPTALFQYGLFPLAKNHYLLAGTASPLALVMNRERFDSLPEAAKALIRQYSGEWTAAAWLASFGHWEKVSLDKLKSEPGHTVVEPSASDLEAAQRIYQSLMDVWIAQSEHNAELWKKMQTDLSEIRSTK